MSNKKTKPSPDELFRSIPPQERFHAFPAVDAFPREAIAFLTGRTSPAATKDAPGPESGTTAPEPSVSGPHAASDSPPPGTPRQRPDTRPRTRPVSRPDSTPPGQSCRHKASPLPDHTRSQFTNQSADHAASHSKGQTKDLTQDHKQDLSQGQTQDLSQDHSFQEATGFTPLDRLNANQRRVLCHLLRIKPEIIKMAHIARATDLGENTTRTIMRRLAALDFLTFKKARDGNIQGVRVAFNQARCAPFEAQARQDQTQGQILSQSSGHKKDLSPSHSLSQSQDQPDTRPGTRPHDSPPLLRDRKESLFPSFEEAAGFDGWSDEFMAIMWPRVFEAGFRIEQVHSVLAARAKIGKGLERDMLAVSLDRADWELERFACLTDLGSGEKVKNPQGYLFTALARWGALRPHPEYVSREEREAESAAKEIVRRKQAEKEAEQALFSSWRETLDAAELETLLLACPGGPKEVWLRNHWRTHVRSGKGPGGGA